MLTQRQIITLADLKRTGLETPEQVISWCKKQIPLTRKCGPKQPGRRKHSRQYYRDIINFFQTTAAQGLGIENSGDVKASPDFFVPKAQRT